METITYRIDELERIVRRLEKDMYHGNGKPGITQRMAAVEDGMEMIGRNLAKLIWALLGGFITVGAAIAADVAVRAR